MNTQEITDDMRQTISEDPPAITDTDLIERATKKWTLTPGDVAGPRQINRFSKLWSRLRGRSKGIDNGGSVVTALFSGTHYSAPALIVAAEIGEEFGWQVGKSTCSEICKLIEECLPKATYAKQTTRLETDEEVRVRMKREAQSQLEQAARDEAQKALKELTAQLLDKRPPMATALIVANYDEDDGDIMADYFSHKVTRQVAIGWRTGQRENFAQLRRAAATFEETAHLGPDAEGDIEHRDNYSGGGGNFVKRGGQHCTGWRVCSLPINSNADGFGYGLRSFVVDEIPEAPEATGGEAIEGENYRIVEQYHEKRGCPIWTVVVETRTERETFNRNKAAAQAAGGWYYRAFGDSEGGFHFTNPDAAKAFAENTLEVD